MRQDDGVAALLGHAQRAIGGSLGHMIQIQDEPSRHHLFQEYLSVRVETKPICVPASHLGRVEGLQQRFYARNVIDQRPAVAFAVASGYGHGALDAVGDLGAVGVHAIAHTGGKSVLHLPGLAGDEEVHGLEESHVDGRSAERVVGQVEWCDLAYAQRMEPIQLESDQPTGFFQVATGQIIEVLGPMPVPQRVYLDAKDDRQLVVGEGGTRLLG